MNLGQDAGGGRAINSFIKRAVRMTQPHSISRLQDSRARMQCVYSALTSYDLCYLLLHSFLTNIEPLDSAGPAGVESSPKSLQSLQVRSLHLPWHHKQISNQSKAKGEFPKNPALNKYDLFFYVLISVCGSYQALLLGCRPRLGVEIELAPVVGETGWEQSSQFRV